MHALSIVCKEWLCVCGYAWNRQTDRVCVSISRYMFSIRLKISRVISIGAKARSFVCAKSGILDENKDPWCWAKIENQRNSVYSHILTQISTQFILSSYLIVVVVAVILFFRLFLRLLFFLLNAGQKKNIQTYQAFHFIH